MAQISHLGPDLNMQGQVSWVYTKRGRGKDSTQEVSHTSQLLKEHELCVAKVLKTQGKNNYL